MTDGARDRTPRWALRLAGGIGLLLVLTAAGLLATVPGELAEKRAYLAAPACPDGTPSDTCTTSVPASVVEKQTRGRSSAPYLRIVEQDTYFVQRVGLVGQQQVYASVRAGDEVMLTYWRGEITAVQFGAAVQQTRESPTEGWRTPLGFGLLLLFPGLLMLGCAFCFHYDYPSAQQPYAWGFGCLLWAGGLPGFVALVVSREDSDIPDVLQTTAGSAVVGAALGFLFTWWLRWRAKKAEDTSDVTPVLPTRRKFVSATVLGDVPYSVKSFNHLIVGEGRPATTPGYPGQAIVRRTLPETLTVRRIRAFRPDDPDNWPYAFKHNGVVLECRDGDHTVLIASRRRDAPLILGALAATSDTADSADTGSGQPASSS